MSFSVSNLYQRKSKSKSPQKLSATASTSASNEDTSHKSGSGNSSALPAQNYLVDPHILPQTCQGQQAHGFINHRPEALVVLPNCRVFTHLPVTQHHRAETWESANSSAHSLHDDNPGDTDDPFTDDNALASQIYVTGGDETLEVPQYHHKKEHQ